MTTVWLPADENSSVVQHHAGVKEGKVPKQTTWLKRSSKQHGIGGLPDNTVLYNGDHRQHDII